MTKIEIPCLKEVIMGQWQLDISDNHKSYLLILWNVVKQQQYGQEVWMWKVEKNMKTIQFQFQLCLLYSLLKSLILKNKF